MFRRDHLILLALALLCASVLIGFGSFSIAALLLAVLALGCGLMALAAPSQPSASAVIAGGAALLAALNFFYVGRWSWPALVPLGVVVGVALVARRDGVISWVSGGIAIGLIAFATLTDWHWGQSTFDVFQIIQGGSGALLHGANPYGPLFQSYILERPSGALDPIPIHFSYGPAVAILAAPARLIGDVRLSSALMLGVVGVCTIALARRGRVPCSDIVALILAFPLFTSMVVLGFADAYSVAGLAVWVLLRKRHPRAATAALALAIASKYTIAIALLPYLVWSRRSRRQVAVAAVAALAVYAAFALWTGPVQFFQDVAGIELSVNRDDGITFAALMHRTLGIWLPWWVGILAFLAMAAVVLRSKPRDEADLLLQAAAVTVAALLMAKWAYLNYYFVPAALWLMSLGAARATEARSPSASARARFASAAA